MDTQVGVSSSIIFQTRERHSSSVFQVSVLLPLLVLYLFIVVIGSSPKFVGDEGGYVYNATRMLHGPSVTPDLINKIRKDYGQDVTAADLLKFRLWWGPGYPILLIPFVVLGLPGIAAKLLNAVLLF